MKFKGIKKVHEGRFITSYNAEYETEAGNQKIYEMVSRDKNITSLEELKRDKCDAVVLIITSPVIPLNCGLCSRGLSMPL